jgi:hypothetical protein
MEKLIEKAAGRLETHSEFTPEGVIKPVSIQTAPVLGQSTRKPNKFHARLTQSWMSCFREFAELFDNFDRSDVFSILHKTTSPKITNIFSTARTEWTVPVTLSVGLDPTLPSFSP